MQPSDQPSESAERGGAHPAQESEPDTREQAQLDLILEAYGDTVSVGPSNWHEVGVRFIYRRNTVLVRDEYLSRIGDFLVQRLGPWERPGPTDRDAQAEDARGQRPPAQQAIEPPEEARNAVVQGVTRLTLPGRGETDSLTVMDWVRDKYGSGVCTVDHLVHIAPPPLGTCPAAEPIPVPLGSAPDPGYTPDRGAGEGVRVVVIDTGLDPDSPGRHPWMNGVTGDDDPKITPGGLLPYAGHGTFAAGVIRSVAPRAEVIVRSFFNRVGATFESQLIASLDDVLREDAPDIISMSAGSYAQDSTGLLAFEVFNETRLRHHKGVALVVAAGNDSTRRQFWPGASPFTVSVGALDTYRRGRAGFSNFGGWVDVYAPGQDLVNAYPAGVYTYQEPPNVGRQETFYGMARWSGTSFSTPVVSGLIAARMSRTGENGRDAAAALLAAARDAAHPGVGAVLLP
jgi:subtilisin family serine protease